MTELISDSGGGLAQFIDGTGYVEFEQWVTENPHWEGLLRERGYLVFRNFAIHDIATFDAVIDLLMRPSHEFSEETSPRSSITARLFTSTDYPAEYPIQFHHEFSYRRNYPDRVAFCCLKAPGAGGATPVADSRKMLDRMSPDVVAKFEPFAGDRRVLVGMGTAPAQSPR